MMRWPRRKANRIGAEEDRLLCEIAAERILLHACGLRAGAAVTWAQMAKEDGDDEEQLAWAFQAYLAASDAEAHGAKARAALDRLANL